MANYLLTNKTVEDLSAIWEYTFKRWSETQADKYYYMLLDCCRDLAESKVLGKHYPEINADILGAKSGQQIIFYRKPRNTNIEIIRILHKRMDLRNRLQE